MIPNGVKIIDFKTRWFIKETENERLHLSLINGKMCVTLTQENVFSCRFDFIANINSVGFSKVRYWETFKIDLRLSDRNVFMWKPMEILNVFNTSEKRKTFFRNLVYRYLVENYKDLKRNISTQNCPVRS